MRSFCGSLLSLVVLFGGCGPGEELDTPNPELWQARTNRGKAKAVYDHIVKHYSVRGTDLFLENYPRLEDDREVAYLWPFAGMFAASGLVQWLGYEDPALERCFDGMEAYWDGGRQPPAYQSFPGAYGGGDRYYDDNAVVGLDSIHNHEITKRPQFLERAEACLTFVMSGESGDCGGGVFWNEQYRADRADHIWSVKTASSSALGVALAVKAYEHTGKLAYLDFARRVYAWVKNTLQDPSDHLYWDSVLLSDQTINRTKWAYNAGAMLTDGVLLHRATGETAYLDDARELAKAARGHFIRMDASRIPVLPSRNPWFAVILLRGYLDLYEVDRDPSYIEAFVDSADHAWTAARRADGFFYEDWSGQLLGRDHWLLTQASMVEVYARLAKFKNE